MLFIFVIAVWMFLSACIGVHRRLIFFDFATGSKSTYRQGDKDERKRIPYYYAQYHKSQQRNKY